MMTPEMMRDRHARWIGIADEAAFTNDTIRAVAVAAAPQVAAEICERLDKLEEKISAEGDAEAVAVATAATWGAAAEICERLDKLEEKISAEGDAE